MRIGKMDKRIRIQGAASTNAQDAHGNPTGQPPTLATVWANIVPITGSESTLGDRVNANLTHQIKIRYRGNLSAWKRAAFGSRLFDINAVVNVDEGNREVTLLCTELTAA